MPLGDIEVALDVHGTLAQDLACRSCGYNLRGLPIEAVCPECETAVGRSVHGDLLAFCDPAWVERLARGMRLLVAAIIASIVLGIIGNVVRGVFPSAAASTGVGVVSACLTVVRLFAYWQITTPDPGAVATAGPGTAATMRVVARWGLIGSSGVETVLMMFGGVNLGAPVQAMTPSVAIITVAWLLASLASVIATYALFRYAASLADRLPDDKLRRSTVIAMWGYVVTTGTIVLLGAIAPFLFIGNATPGAGVLVLGLAFMVLIIPGVVFWIWSVVLAFKYRHRMSAAATRARDTWARAA
ncbi:MAG: hypothetical protein ACYTGR_12150 [Planctomycetota bacterium]